VQNIGEDLFAIALDQPFRFPATFTFVLRAFSTLEGLGKVTAGRWQLRFAGMGRSMTTGHSYSQLLSWYGCALLQALDPNYSFSETAKPYALELLNLQVCFVFAGLQPMSWHMLYT
jgi:hypothetical protein